MEMEFYGLQMVHFPLLGLSTWVQFKSLPPPKKETFKRIDFEVKWNWYIGVVHHERNNLSKHHVRNAAWKNKHRSIAKQGDVQSPFLDKAPTFRGEPHVCFRMVFMLNWFTSCLPTWASLSTSLFATQINDKYQEPKNVAMSAETWCGCVNPCGPSFWGVFPP